MASGAFAQIEDERAVFEECLRVPRPGGSLTCHDWMRPEGGYSDDLRQRYSRGHRPA